MSVAIVVVVLVVVAGTVWWLRRPRPFAKLTIREGDTVGLEFPLTTAETTIGSEAGQTVVVSHPKVSRHHAVITRTAEGRFMLEDRSKRGTSVNGKAVSQRALRSGDLIRLADSVDLIFTRLR